MSDNVPPIAPNVIKLEQLSTTGAISAIGLIAARMLQQHGIVTLMVGTDGNIEVVPAGELELDSLTEHEALLMLVDQSYTDTQMTDYLRQRQLRDSRRKAQEGQESSSKDDHR